MPFSEPLIFHNWKSTLPVVDHHWVSKALFRMNTNGKTEFQYSTVHQLWYYPPQPNLITRNRMDRFFAHRLFLWMPVNMWGVVLRRTNGLCNRVLTKSGMHGKTRLVLDVDSFYNIASEYLSCNSCNKKVFIILTCISLFVNSESDSQSYFCLFC